MEKEIAQAIVMIPGKHVGYFKVYEIGQGMYRAIPLNSWKTEHRENEYDEFIFYRTGNIWVTDPYVNPSILEQILEVSRLEK